MRRLLFLLLFLLVAEFAAAPPAELPATLFVPLSLTAGASPATTTLAHISFCVWIKNDDATNSATVAVNGGSALTLKPTETVSFGCGSNFATASLTYARVGGSNVALRGGAEELAPL